MEYKWQLRWPAPAVSYANPSQLHSWTFGRMVAVRLGIDPGKAEWLTPSRRDATNNECIATLATLMDERRNTERILLKFPIRVSAFGGSAGTFSEETYTVEVNRAGARIALKHRVAPNDTIRIVNLENLREADFRVVGPCRLEGGGFGDWGVECLEPDRNLWEIKFSPPLETHTNPAGALLKCGECGTQSFCALRDWEFQILESGPLQRFCQECGAPTAWQHADVNHRVGDVHPLETPATAAAAAPLPPGTWAHKRVFKRLALKLPILVRDQNGGQEIAKTENLSKGGLAVCLGLRLEVGDVVTVCCPYSEGGQNLEQKAEVRSRVTFFIGERWIYGLCYIAATP